METINERVQKVLKASSLTQSEFAEKIGIKQGSLSLICSGKSGIGDRTIADICRVFGVDLIWLRTGVGEMFKQKTREEALAEIFARAQIDDDDRSRLLRAIAQLPDEYLPIFVKGLEKICKILSENK